MRTSLAAFRRCLAFGLSLGILALSHATALAQAPILVGVSPNNTGSVAGGSTVELGGNYFDTVTLVTFGGVPATILLHGADTLSVTVATPAHVAGPVDIVVFNPSGSSTGTGWFTYVDHNDVARDFSKETNPSPRWTYGMAPSRGGAFTAYTQSSRGTYDYWSAGGGLPNLHHNYLPFYAPSATNTTPPGGFALHPGAAGENSVARWTAPGSGTYRIAGHFVGTDTGPTTTDVAILHNNNGAAPLFSGVIASYDVPLPFSIDRTVTAGDTIEFTVGFGTNGNYFNDTTGLSATITPIAPPPSPTVVTNTDNLGPGSLRAAMTYAKDNCGSGPHTITFNIPGAGPHVISPLSSLPAITCDGTVIDGYTQPGSAPNTLASGGNNADLRIQLDGISSCRAFDISFGTDNVVIRGLAITRWSCDIAYFNTCSGCIMEGCYMNVTPAGVSTTGGGVYLNTVSNGRLGGPTPAQHNLWAGSSFAQIYMNTTTAFVIQNNRFNMDRSGAAFATNRMSQAIYVNAASNSFLDNIFLATSSSAIYVGGPNHTFTGNRFEGVYQAVYFSSGTGNQFSSNVIIGATSDAIYVGTSSNTIQGNSVSGSGGAGVYVSGTNTNVIGNLIENGASAGMEVNGNFSDVVGNVIRNNAEEGIKVFGQGIVFSQNSSYGNAGPGIDLNGDGPTVNDESAPPYDADAGPNNLQNYPVVTSVAHIGGNTVVNGYFKSEAPCCGSYLLGVELFHNNVARAVTEGEMPVAVFELTDADLAGPGHWQFTHTIVGFLANNVSATAYYDTCGDGCDASSEYSPSVAAITPATVPGAPTIGSATGGDAQATVTFTPPASDGGAPITSYTVTSSPGGITASGSASPITVIGLANGTPYTFRVTATNAMGTGPASAPSNPVTPAGLVPSLALTPPSLAFASRTVNTTSPAQTVTLTNTGSATLTIASITVSGDFSFVSACPASVASGGTCTIEVTFTPLATGARAGTLMITTNAAGSPHAVALSGTGLATPAPVLALVTSIVEFPPQAVGTESAVGIATVRNAGNAVLVFGPITTTGDFARRPIPAPAVSAGKASSAECGAELAAGASCDIGVVFRPLAEGIRDGELAIASNATPRPASVRLIGTGVVGPPARVLSIPTSVAFDARPVGTRSDGVAVTIRNASPTAVSITGLEASGDFGVSDTCTIIAARGTCVVLVSFRPTEEGERTGSLTIRTLGELEPYLVSLRGVGVFNAIPALELSITRAGFGNALLGSATTIVVDLVNVGQVAVSLGAITATGDFLVSHACGASLAVDARCPVQVRFFPRIVGGQAGILEVVSNAAGAPHQVQLSGTGCAIPSIARSRVRPLLCAP